MKQQFTKQNLCIKLFFRVSTPTFTTLRICLWKLQFIKACRVNEKLKDGYLSEYSCENNLQLQEEEDKMNFQDSLRALYP